MRRLSEISSGRALSNVEMLVEWFAGLDAYDQRLWRERNGVSMGSEDYSLELHSYSPTVAEVSVFTTGSPEKKRPKRIILRKIGDAWKVTGSVVYSTGLFAGEYRIE